MARRATIKRKPQVQQGEFYLDDHGHLTVVARVDREQFNLISLSDGNRWTDAFDSLAAVTRYVREKGWEKIEADINIGEN